MSKTFTVSCIGAGQRGFIYLSEMMKLKDNKFKIISICDKNEVRLKYFQKVFNVDPQNCFLDEDEFFKNNTADLCVVSTQDQAHVNHAIKAMESGSNVLCEKPISDNKEGVLKLLEAQKKYQKQVMVCHVLRFAPAFVQVKKWLNNHEIGDIVTIDSIENVHYPHQAHSYVRGNWRRKEDTSPMIIAKCCHDLDLFYWYTESKCLSVSSIGDLRFFKKENQPEGASDRCKDCKYRGKCEYDAYEIYVNRDFWGREIVTNTRPITDEAVIEALDKGPYGRCVFACDNDVVDNQIVMMRFANGITVNLRMIGLTAYPGRIMKFYGTHGQIDLDEVSGHITLTKFGKEPIIKNISTLTDATNGHGGGDHGLIEALYEYLSTGKSENVSSLDASVESHLIGFAAEESRLNDGRIIFLK